MAIPGGVYLVTGASGSLGRMVLKTLALQPGVQAIRCLSRNEENLRRLERDFIDYRDPLGEPLIRPLLGDVRDKERLLRAARGVDVVLHFAALKFVSRSQYDPWEFVLTNVQGTANVVRACIENGVKWAVFSSTDKAVNPQNTYGSTKLLAEQLWLTGNLGAHQTRFSFVRYGNVLSSNGSVLEVWAERARQGLPLPMTHPDSTRFYLTLPQAAGFVLGALTMMNGGELFLPKIKAASLADIKEALYPNSPSDVSVLGPGEKLHEAMVSPEEVRYLRDVGPVYMRRPNVPSVPCLDYGQPVPVDFVYSSDRVARYTPDELRQLAGFPSPEAAA